MTDAPTKGFTLALSNFSATLATVKQQLNITASDEDAYLTVLLNGAVRIIAEYTNIEYNGASSYTAPADMDIALMQMVAHLYAHRGDEETSVPTATREILDRHIVIYMT